MKKEAKRMEKRHKKDGSDSSVVDITNDDGTSNKKSTGYPEKKEKKKFWKLPTKSKRKQKSEDSTTSNSTGDSSKSLKLAALNYAALGFTESPRKVAIKDPEETFNETLDKFLKLQLETREDEGSEESDAKKSTKAAVLVETVNSTEEKESKISGDAKLESDNSTKEQTTIVENNESTRTEDVDVVGIEKSNPKEQRSSWLGKASGIFKKDKKAKPPTTVTVINKNKESSDEKVTEEKEIADTPDVAKGESKPKETIDCTEELNEKGTQSQESKENLKQSDAWLEQIAGLFKKEDDGIPPVSVVKVDKFDVDKYESFAESESKIDCAEIQAGVGNIVNCMKPASVAGTEEKSPDEGNNNTMVSPDTEPEETTPDPETVESDAEKATPKLVPNFVVIHHTEGAVLDTAMIELAQKEEERNATIDEKDEDGFLQTTHCPCMPSQQQQKLSIETTDNNEEGETRTETKAESPTKELSWYEMATGFFAIAATPKSDEANKTAEKNNEGDEESAIENEVTTQSSLLQTPKTSNNKEQDFVSAEGDALKGVEQAPMFPEPTPSGTFDDNQFSLQNEGRSNTFDNSLLTTSQEGTFDNSLLSKEDVRSGSFDDSLITLEEGTKVTKIEPAEPMDKSRTESLLDLEASQSASLMSGDDDKQRKEKMHEEETIESRSCADSTNQCKKPDPPSSIADGESRSAMACIKPSITDEVESKSKSKSKASESSENKNKKKKKKKKRISMPTDVVFFKKNKKKLDGTDDEQGTARAVITSKYSNNSTIFDFSPENLENSGYNGNRSGATSPAALPPLVMNSHVKTAEMVAKEPRQTTPTTKQRGKKKEVVAATLFGRLEPHSDGKKRKKKTKRTQTLF